MERPELEPGTIGTAIQVVGAEDLASAIAVEPADAFPAVYATSRMIALMEVAASRAMTPLLEAGELSVGVTVDVKHTAPTPPGVVVTAAARFVEREGKLYVFEVVATDEEGEIGRGLHKRAIVT